MNLQLIGEFFFAGLICLENFSNGVVNRIRNFILGLITIDDDNLHTLFLVHLYSTMEIIVYFFLVYNKAIYVSFFITNKSIFESNFG